MALKSMRWEISIKLTNTLILPSVASTSVYLKIIARTFSGEFCPCSSHFHFPRLWEAHSVPYSGDALLGLIHTRRSPVTYFALSRGHSHWARAYTPPKIPTHCVPRLPHTFTLNLTWPVHQPPFLQYMAWRSLPQLLFSVTCFLGPLFALITIQQMTIYRTFVRAPACDFLFSNKILY